jgi:hypothetical protein
MSTPEIELPKWWRVKLYKFTESMPLEGWVWEFMRRAELKAILKGAPVDAMNPRPRLKHIQDDMASYYYMGWDKVIKRFRWWGDKPFFRVPALSNTEGWPPGFHGQPIRIPTPRSKRIKLQFSIDLNRRDTVIKKEFDAILAQHRVQIPEPGQIKPHVSNWPKPLMVWDLCQYHIPRLTIARLLDISPGPGARVGKEWMTKQVENCYNEITPYIDKGKWEDLARFIGTN